MIGDLRPRIGGKQSRSTRRGPLAARARARTLLQVEGLEARIAPAVTIGLHSGYLTIQGNAATDAVGLRLIDPAHLQILDNGVQAGLAIATSTYTTVQVYSGTGPLSLAVDQTLVGRPPAGGIQFLGGNGSTINTLYAPDGIVNQWTISGANQGTLDGVVKFASVENLVGGNLDDVFTIINGSAIAQNFIGGPGNVVITDGAASLNILGDVTSQGNITIAAGAITVYPSSIIASRQTGTMNFVTGASTGNSGNISLTAPTISLQAGSQILAGVNAGSPYVAGDVALTATNTASRVGTDPFTFTTQSASIALLNATITGGAISLLATSSDLNPSNDLPSYVQSQAIQPLLQGGQVPSLLANFALPATVEVRGSSASVILTGSILAGTGAVTIKSSTAADASVQAIGTNDPHFPKQRYSVGYGRSQATALSQVLGNSSIMAGGDVDIESNATNTAFVTSHVAPVPKASVTDIPTTQKEAGFSIAIADTQTVSNATLASTSTISSTSGNVRLFAGGSVTASPAALAPVASDGTAGVGIALNFEKSDIQSFAQGKIVAPGRVDAGRAIAPGAVNVPNASLTIPNHGYNTGDQVVYSDGGGGPIGGLVDGQTYDVLVLDPNTIQLTQGLGLSVDNSGVNPGAQQSFSRRAANKFDPAVAVQANTLTIPQHLFSRGDVVNYYCLSGTTITGLDDQTTYYVVLPVGVTSSTFMLAATAADAAIGKALTISYTPQAGVTSSNALAYLISPIPFDASSPTVVNSGNGVFTIANNGLSTGDPVVYHVAPTAAASKLVVSDFTFNPASIANLSNPGGVNLPLGLINVPGNNFVKGQAVVYRADEWGVLGTPIGGLNDGQTYYVIPNTGDPNLIQLATTAANASGGTSIHFTSAGTGLQQAFQANSAVKLADFPIAGIEDGGTYFVTVLNANQFRLAATALGAFNALPVAFAAISGTGPSQHLVGRTAGTQGITVAADLVASDASTAASEDTSAPTITGYLTSINILPFVVGLITPSTVQPFLAYVPNSLQGGVLNTLGSVFQPGVGLALDDFAHTTIARADAASMLQSSADLAITATTAQATRLTDDATAGIGVDGNPIAAAVGIGGYGNLTNALVAGGATLDALGQVRVIANLTYPLPFGLPGYNPIVDTAIDQLKAAAQIGTEIGKLFKDGEFGLPSSLFNVYVAAKNGNVPAVSPGGTKPVKTPISFSASLAYINYANDSEALIGKGALINQDAPYQDSTQSVVVDATTDLSSFAMVGVAHLNLGVNGALQAIKSGQDQAIDSTGCGIDKGVGGSALVQSFNDTTIAEILAVAKVHTGAAGPGLVVDAEHRSFAVDLAQSGGDSGMTGISGSVSVILQTSITLAELASGVLIAGGPIAVLANDVSTPINLAGAIEQTTTTGIGLSVADNEVNRTTQAIVGRQRTALDSSAGTSGTIITASGEVTVHATESGSLVALALAGAKTSAAQKATSGTPQSPTSGSSTATTQQGTTPTGTGIGFVGSAAVNDATDATQAYVNDKGSMSVTGGAGLDLAAGDATNAIALAGSVAFVSGQAAGMGSSPGNTFKDSLGIAGAFALNNLTNTSEAFLAGVLVPITGAVAVESYRGGHRIALAAGIAASKDVAGAYSIAGSAAVNHSTDATLSYVDGAVLANVTGNLALIADDGQALGGSGPVNAVTIALAGGAALSVGGKLGFGAGVAVNQIARTTRADVQGLSTINLGGNALAASAIGTNSLYAIGMSLGLGQYALTGGVGVNILDGPNGPTDVPGTAGGSGLVEAGIQGRSRVTTTAAVTLTSTDDSTYSADGGGVSFAINPSSKNDTSQAKAAIGAGVGVNDLAEAVRANVDSSTVAAGSLTLGATSAPNLQALGFSGAVAVQNGKSNSGSLAAAGAGAASVNYLNDAVFASITGSAAPSGITAGSVALTATDAATIYADAGGVAIAVTLPKGSGGGGALSVGLSVALNQATDTATATIDNGVVVAGGSVSLTALESSSIKAVTIGGAASASSTQGMGLDGAGAGAGSGNTTHDGATASIVGGSSVTATGAIGLTATNVSSITADAGGVALAISLGKGSSSNGALSVGISVAINSITDTTLATINASTALGSSVTLAAGDSQGGADATIRALTIGGAGAGSSSMGTGLDLAGAGAGSGNTVADSVTASIINSGGANSVKATGNGAVTLSATDNASITADAGGVAVAISYGKGSGGGGAISVGIAAATNSITDSAVATIDNSGVSGGSVLLGAAASSTIEALTIGAAVSGTSTQGLGLAGAGAGSGSGNTVHDTVAATIVNSNGTNSVTTPGALLLTATDNASITADAGGLAIAASLGKGSSPAGSLAIGLALAINTVGDTTRASILNSTVVGGLVTLAATATSAIDAVTVGGAVAANTGMGLGLDGAGAGAGSGNTTTDVVIASIVGGTVSSTGPIALSATDDASITADAGGVALAASLSTSGSFSGAVSIGIALAKNSITDVDTATITNAIVAGSTSSLAAMSNATIKALTIAAAGSLATSKGVGLAGSGAGAGSSNTINDTTQATIVGDGGAATVTSTVGGITLLATDVSSITADAGGLALAAALGSGPASLGIAFGIALAINSTTDVTLASINDATVTSAGPLTIGATTAASIQALALGGALAAGVSTSGLGLAGAGAGAGSGNTIGNITTASIVGGSSATATGAIGLTALDLSSITADAGGVALAAGIAAGGTAGVALSVGVALSQNTITDATQATINNAKVSGPSVALVASDYLGNMHATIKALSVAAGASVGYGTQVGVGLAGAGAASTNTIGGTIDASIVASNGLQGVRSPGAITLSATDGASITADGGGLAISLGLSSGDVGAAVSVGASLASNTITDTARATISNSFVAASALSLYATSTATIQALTLAGAVGAGVGTMGAGIALSGAGAVSTNAINDVIETSILGGSVVTVPSGVGLTSLDNATIKAATGAFAIALAGGLYGGVAVGIGVALTTNSIGDTVSAFLDHATLTSTAGALDLSASSTSTINSEAYAGSLAVGVGVDPNGSLGIGAAGAGTAGTNTLASVVQAYIDDNSQVIAAGVSVTTSDTPTITSFGLGGSIAASVGLVGASFAVGVVLANNTVDDTVRSFIGAPSSTTDATSVASTGAVNAAVVTALSDPSVTSLSIAFSVSASISIGVAASGAGANAQTTTGQLVTASVQGGAHLTSDGPITIGATDTPILTATVGVGSLSIGLVGASIGVGLVSNSINDFVQAFVTHAVVTSVDAGISISSAYTPDIAKTQGVAVSISSALAGGGVNATADVKGTSEAYAGAGAVLSASLGAVSVDASSTATSDAEADGGSGGLAIAVSVMIASSTIEDATLAHVSQDAIVHAGSLAVGASATDANFTNETLASVALAASGAGTSATSTDSHVVQAYIGQPSYDAQANLVAPGAGLTQVVVAGPVSVSATSNVTSDLAKAAGGSGSVLLTVSAFFATATDRGLTYAYVGPGAAIASGPLSVLAKQAGGASTSLLVVGVAGLASGVGANADTEDQAVASAFIGQATGLAFASNATLVNAGAVTVAATSNEADNASATGGAGAIGVAIGALIVKAVEGGSTLAYVGQGATINASSLTVNATAASQVVNASSFIISIGLLAGGAGAHTEADVNGDIEAFAAPGVHLNVSGQSIIAALANARPSVGATAGAGALLLSVSALVTTVNVGESVSAYLGGGSTVGTALAPSGGLSITADSATDAYNTATVGSGGLLSGNGTDDEIHLTPTIRAYIGPNTAIVSSGNVTLAATSDRQDGHSTAKSYGGGGVQVGVPQALTFASPVVSTYVASGTTILAAGNVRIAGAALSPQPSGNPNDPIQGYNAPAGTITYNQHGLGDGDPVIYQAGPGAALTGVLTGGRTYTAIVVDPSTIKLGGVFTNDLADASNPLFTVDPSKYPGNPPSAQGVDPSLNVIRFATIDNFVTGDRVEFDAGSSNLAMVSIGLTPGTAYYVRVVDPQTIKLYATLAGATNPNQVTFAASGATSNTINAGNPYYNGERVTYNAPSQHDELVNFGSAGVNVNFSGSNPVTDVVNGVHVLQHNAAKNNLFLATGFDSSSQQPNDGPVFQTGDAVVFYSSNINAQGYSPIGLRNGQVYYAIRTGPYEYQLATTYGDAIVPQNQVTLTQAGGGSFQLRLAPIPGLVDGKTYVVLNRVGDTFQLGDPLAGNPNAVIGFAGYTADSGFNHSVHDTFTQDGIALNAVTPGVAGPGVNLGTVLQQDIYIDLNGATAPETGGDELFGAELTTDSNGNFSYLPVALAMAGDGTSSADAEGGQGGFISVSLPYAKVTMDPNVTTYADPASIQAGGDVIVTATTQGLDKVYASGVAGGFIQVGKSQADSNYDPVTEAFIGNPGGSIGTADATGVRIVAGGQFILRSETSYKAADIHAEADGGGFIAVSVTTSNSTFDDTGGTSATVGTGAQIAANTVDLEADVAFISVHETPHATAGGFGGASTANANQTTRSASTVTIDAYALITGYAGVDVRALTQDLSSSLQPEAHFYGLFGGSSSPSNNDNTVTSTVVGAANATVTAEPRATVAPLGGPLPLAQVGHDSKGRAITNLALYVQADDVNNNAGGATRHRTIAWDSNVNILSGADPVLTIAATGQILQDNNISIAASRDGTPLAVGAFLTPHTTYYVRTTQTGGTAYFFGQENTANGYQYPTFNFGDTVHSVTITNASSVQLDIVDVDVVSLNSANAPAGLPAVDIDSGSVPNFKFSIAHIESPSIVDIENTGTGSNASSVVILGDGDGLPAIDNPIGLTIINNFGGGVEAGNVGGLNGFILTNSLAVQAATNIGNGPGNPLYAQLVQYALGGTTVAPVISAVSGGPVGLNLTARRRDGLSGGFTINSGPIAAGRVPVGFVDPLSTANRDVFLLLNPSVVDGAPNGSAGALHVTQPQQGLSGGYNNFYLPDNGGSPGLDYGLFADETTAFAVASTYAFEDGCPPGHDGQVGLPAGLSATGNLSVTATDSTTAGPAITVLGTINLNPTAGDVGKVNVTTYGGVTLTETHLDMRVGTIQSNGGSVVLYAPANDPTGDDATLAAGSAIYAPLGNVTIDVADNFLMAGDVTAGVAAGVAAGTSPLALFNASGAATISTRGTAANPSAPGNNQGAVTINGDYTRTPGQFAGSTINLGGLIYTLHEKLTGSTRADTIGLTNVTPGTQAEVDPGPGGNNTINVGSLTPFVLSASLDAGVTDLIQGSGPLLINGSAGDFLNVDDRGSIVRKAGALLGPASSGLAYSTLNGLDMGAAGIDFKGLGTLDMRLGSGGSTLGTPFGNRFVATNPDPTVLTELFGGSSTNDGLTLNYTADQRGVVYAPEWECTAPTNINVAGTVYGTLDFFGSTVDNIIIGAAVAPSGVIDADMICTTIAVGPPACVVGDDMAGTITITGSLASLGVAGALTGTVTAGRIGTIAVYCQTNLPACITEGGVKRCIVISDPNSFCQTPVPGPASVSYEFLYESAGLSSPQVSIRLMNSATGAGQYDLSLQSFSPTAKYNLARLDSMGATGVRNIAVEGDLLTTVTPAGVAFFGLPTTAARSSLGGIYLPQDALAGVAVRDEVLGNGLIHAKSIEAVAFGSRLDPVKGVVELGANSTGVNDAMSLLGAGTKVTAALGTFLVPFSEAANEHVGFFAATDAPYTALSNDLIEFAVESNNGVPSNTARGAVIAQIKIIPAYNIFGDPTTSIISEINLCGDGGSIITAQPVSNITSSGPLGDITILAPFTGTPPAPAAVKGIGNVTAPSLFGSVVVAGPISGIIQTTGIRTDPITDLTSIIPATIGLVTLGEGGPIDTVIRSTGAYGSGAALTGAIISRGQLLSQVIASGGISGTIASVGDIGEILTLGGQTFRIGGVITPAGGPLLGQIITLGNIDGDIIISGQVIGGRIAAQKSILGNLTLSSGMSGTGAIVSGGSIGSATLGTSLTFAIFHNAGIVAALGSVNGGAALSNTSSGVDFQNLGTDSTAAGLASAAVIDDIFSGPSGPTLGQTSFDIGLLDLAELSQYFKPKLGKLRLILNASNQKILADS